MRPGLSHLTALFWAIVLCGGAAAAQDVQVSSKLWGEGYSVPAADGTLISRRRLVEDLHLAAWNLVPGSDDPYYRGPRFSVELSMRLDTDFSVGASESDADDLDNYVPGLTPVQMDMMFAYVDARGFWDGVLDARLGRQIRLDTAGYFAFDGAETTLHLPGYLGLSAFIGYEVRGGDTLGYDQLELDGTDTGGRDGMSSDRYTDRTDPDRRLAFGTEVSWYPSRWLDVAAAVRLAGLSQELAEQRFAARFTAGDDPVRVHGRVVWQPMLDRRDDLGEALEEGSLVSEADGEVVVTPVRWLAVTGEYHLYRPTFEADSIFNVFDLVPRRDLGLRADVRPVGSLSLATWGYLRLADESAGLDGEEDDALLSGAGGGVGGNYNSGPNSLSARVSYLKEWGESRLGAELGGGRELMNRRLALGLRLSYWRLEDDFSSTFGGDILGYVVSARFRLLQGAHLAGEFENYYSDGRDPSFVVLVLLQLDLWR